MGSHPTETPNGSGVGYNWTDNSLDLRTVPVPFLDIVWTDLVFYM